MRSVVNTRYPSIQAAAEAINAYRQESVYGQQALHIVDVGLGRYEVMQTPHMLLLGLADYNVTHRALDWLRPAPSSNPRRA